ncbi:MAG: hypothetical protein GWM92_18770 [Gemmatimonadetes bacterium]|nr:hypothetical protein [Gemmatimonadota bacterium]NIR80844.1 hypothetical protein [Gemmatimonadota bacterium]NIT89663.1 hypothetical protein [Gemmatimonadota bacterium]NIU33443.1 hypothetical protein [Gemmatimonadota bacterium]NIU37731.1 hypothetical protein [Gemmatimonadota bacterium]
MGDSSGRLGGILALVLVLSGSVIPSSCATLREVTALRRVEFSLAGISGGTLAGVSIEDVRNAEAVGPLNMARFAAAVSRGELPLEAVLEVRATNPPDNARARLVGLDWALFLDHRETLRGALADEYLLPPGEPVMVPVRVEVDLIEFFGDQLEEVLDLALAVAGAGEPQRVRLEATPTVQTPVGPIRYPEPVRIDYEAGG